MKKFRFALDRVMEWRRTEARVEEAKLERLLGELRRIDARAAELEQERSAAEMAVAEQRSNRGEDLAALDVFQRFTVAEGKRLAAKRNECGERVTAQMSVVGGKRRGVRLIEKLKERRVESWRTELDRENQAQAEEGYLARWNRG
jgi:hypothetical protein